MYGNEHFISNQIVTSQLGRQCYDNFPDIFTIDLSANCIFLVYSGTYLQYWKNGIDCLARHL